MDCYGYKERYQEDPHGNARYRLQRLVLVASYEHNRSHAYQQYGENEDAPLLVADSTEQVPECRCGSLDYVGLVGEAQDEGNYADQCWQPSPQASEPGEDRGIASIAAKHVFSNCRHKEIAREQR